MGKMKIVTVAVVLMVVFVCGNPNKVLVRKAKAGETAILPCLTEDEVHRFQYWQLNDDQIIGPWNNNDHGKIKYEVWTGRLMIKVNTYRAVIGILVLLMVIMIGLFAFFIKRRKMIGFQDSKEDSPDDIISAAENKGVYRTTSISMTRPSTSRSKSTEQRSYENAIVETDITTSFSLPN